MKIALIKLSACTIAAALITSSINLAENTYQDTQPRILKLQSKFFYIDMPVPPEIIAMGHCLVPGHWVFKTFGQITRTEKGVAIRPLTIDQHYDVVIYAGGAVACKIDSNELDVKFPGMMLYIDIDGDDV